MTTTRQRQNILKSEAGLISLDFIFALSLAFGFSIVFFAMAFTLSMVEVGQYVTYATARAFNGAHENQNLQREIALKKFDELKTTGALRRVLSNNWIKLSNPRVGDFNLGGDYPEESPDNEIFVGAQVSFEAKVLNIRLPVLGATAEDSETGKATLNAYLMREVTSEECREGFNRQRYQKLRRLYGKYGQVPNATEALVTDNGC